MGQNESIEVQPNDLNELESFIPTDHGFIELVWVPLLKHGADKVQIMSGKCSPDLLAV